MLGANVAIIQGGRILLTLREDFEVWCLPGGHVDPGESFGQAAIRETREELGLDVRLTRQVGLYMRPNWQDGVYCIVLFAAEVTGGTLSLQPDEILEARYFAPDALPEKMVIGHHHRVRHALDGASGLVVREAIPWPLPDVRTRQMLYARRDSSGLAKDAFYLKHFPPLRPEQVIVEADSA